MSDLPPADEQIDGRVTEPDPPRGIIVLNVAAEWRAAGKSGLLLIASNEQDAEHVGANLYALFPECSVLVLPRWDCPPYDAVGPSREIMGRRASVLRRLASGLAAPLVIATVEAVLQRVPPRSLWTNATLRLEPGTTALDELRVFLERTGYGLDMLVDEPGEAAIHGQVVDIYPAGALGPVRIDHDGRCITRICSYDPVSQRTSEELPGITLDAASEFLAPADRCGGMEADPGGGQQSPWLSRNYASLDTLFDYMPGALVRLNRYAEERASLWLEQVREAFESARPSTAAPPASGETLPDPRQLYCLELEWRGVLRQRGARQLGMADELFQRVPVFATEQQPSRRYRQFIAAQREQGRRIVLAAADACDLKLLARRAQHTPGAAPRSAPGWQHVVAAAPGETLLLKVDFEAGFVHAAENIAVVAAADLLGSRAGRQVPMELPRSLAEGAADTAFRIGNAVIHREHGIGLLRGIESVGGDGKSAQDTIRIEYASDAMLMVPVQEIGLLWRYGAEPDAVSLDRLGGESWRKRRDEIGRQIAETAHGLIRLTRDREARAAPKLNPEASEYERFVLGFPFVATADQARAVEDILADLKSGHPMDRLVCGDVGFGKTEVALRAAAAAVLSGWQVAVVVPTTVLARQHLGTFRRRFASFAKQIAPLSRLATAAEIRAVKQGLAGGTIEIVIGTHAIAGKGVRFKRLGLLIIDEEQRFGTGIKQKLRAFAEGVHVLTLSATPIPRTLQGAMVGLHSLSLLETPPARRLPIQTFVLPFEAGAVRLALLSEHRRRGQSFFVCPRIEDLEPMATRLRDIVPELVIKAVHGRMPAADIDDVMVAFGDGEGDVLLATNIIESGLDLPRANTMLVWRPDRFGVAQLHQLRGRVGRGRRRGLAYLLTDPATKITAATEKRLRLLTELDRLGAGFAISRRDMDMRGAGDLLGEAQAGHVRLIGIELYRDLLDRALADARGGIAAEDTAIDLNLDVTGSIPADYVSDPEIRINLYSQLARLRDTRQIDEFAEEIEDRFGHPLPAVAILLDLARLREMARGLGIVRIDAGPRAIAVTFEPAAAERWSEFIVKAGKKGRLYWKEDRLVSEHSSEIGERIAALFQLFEELEQHSL